MEELGIPILEQLKNCHHRLDIEIVDLCYYVTQYKGRKSTQHAILNGINGRFKSGHLTAILGASGAGKSSLLNVLSGFRTHGVVGKVLVNGRERNASEFKRLSCYIPQDFALLSSLTTEETLMIAADLKLGTNVKKSMKESLVEEILQIVGLLKVKSTQVGKLSGGGRKRLSIGVELVTNPPIMFFDEPTSGLDSVSSLQMITYMKSLAEAGRTVICSIHQPSSHLFEMFDDIFVLAEGQCLYNGPLDKLTNVLEEEGFICPKYYNRADFAIEVATKERGDDINKLITRFKRENLKSCDVAILDPVNTRERPAVVDRVGNCKQFYEYSAPTYFQLFVLIKRSMICTYRDSYLGIVRVVSHVLVGLLIGALGYDYGNNASKVLSNVACIFFFVFFIFILSPAVTVLCFPMEAAVFLREHQNNWYSLRAYFLSKFISDLPLQIICPTILLLEGYTLTGQPCDNLRPLKFWLLCLLVSMCAQSMGFATGAAFKVQLSIFVVIAVNVPMVLFSGFYVKITDIVGYLRWITELSYCRFAFEGSMVILFSNRTQLECTEIYCHFKNPSELLEQFDMKDATAGRNFIALLIWFVIYQVLFYFALKWRLYRSR